jgi:hypothetical protein
MAFRRENVLRRWAKGEAPEDVLLELGAQAGDTDVGAEAGEGSARGTKKGRFAALREFGGSSEYREWIRGTATGDWVVSMVVCGRYIWHWDGWDGSISYLCACDVGEVFWVGRGNG